MRQTDRWPEVTVDCRDGRKIEVFRRKDRIPVVTTGGRPSTRRAWGYRMRAVNGRVTSSNDRALTRGQAIEQAIKLAGRGAKVRNV